MTGRLLVVFDVDGTLVDSQHHIVAAMNAALAALGLGPLPRERVLSIVGLSLPVAVARLLPDLDPAVQAELVERYKDAWKASTDAAAAPLYPGARAELDRLRAEPGIRLGVATGKSRRGWDSLAAAHGFAGFFDTVQVADDHPSKPHPSMLWRAMEETGLQAGVMIGDTTFDLEMGRAAGLKTIAVGWGYHPVADLLRFGPDHMIHDFAALAGTLAQIAEEGR